MGMLTFFHCIFKRGEGGGGAGGGGGGGGGEKVGKNNILRNMFPVFFSKINNFSLLGFFGSLTHKKGGDPLIKFSRCLLLTSDPSHVPAPHFTDKVQVWV